tara:strand:+ start:457 stop:837 length:381 start_codon:yes stop_codon:yes gene_type:complete
MTKTTKSDTLKKQALIEALEKSLGVVTTACKSVGIARSTYYEWLAKDEHFKKDVASITELALDFAESQLHKQIQDGSTTATIFYLKTKGKKRGYIERHEITGAGGENLNFTIEIIDNSEDTDEYSI